MKFAIIGIFFASIAAPAVTATPLPASILFERCEAFIETPESTDAQLCEAYLRGFLHGVKATGGKQRRQTEDESWTDRAARTRLGTVALARASYCVPSGITVTTLAEQFVSHLDTNPKLKDTDARSALEATLHVNYACAARKD